LYINISIILYFISVTYSSHFAG